MRQTSRKKNGWKSKADSLSETTKQEEKEEKGKVKENCLKAKKLHCYSRDKMLKVEEFKTCVKQYMIFDGNIGYALDNNQT